jgi:hypothetical protein
LGVARRTIKLWQLIVAGPFLIWAGIHEYFQLADLEENGGVLFVGRFTAFLYRMGGKHLVLVIVCGCGGFYVWALSRWIRDQRELARLRAADQADHAGPNAAPPVKPAVKPRRDPPPRIDDDPFRSPPAPAPIAAPSVGTHDEPKLLR